MSLTPRATVVIVDDHSLFRAGVMAELADLVDVVGEAGSVADAVRVVLATRPDVVLLDVHMPDGGGLRVIEEVTRRMDTDGARFLAVSVSDRAEDVIDLVRAGARGYVTKDVSRADLVDAITRVCAGDAFFSPMLAGFVLDAFRGASAAREPPSELATLTAREREVMQLLARGYAYKEIATDLYISVKTVESHASSVLRKLQVTSRHELARWAADHKLL